MKLTYPLAPALLSLATEVIYSNLIYSNENRMEVVVAKESTAASVSDFPEVFEVMKKFQLMEMGVLSGVITWAVGLKST